MPLRLGSHYLALNIILSRSRMNSLRSSFWTVRLRHQQASHWYARQNLGHKYLQTRRIIIREVEQLTFPFINPLAPSVTPMPSQHNGVFQAREIGEIVRTEGQADNGLSPGGGTLRIATNCRS